MWGGGAFIRSVSIRFQEALPEIRPECVVIPPGSPLDPASFTTLPSLSLSMHASRSMILIKHHPGSVSRLPAGRDGNSELPKIKEEQRTSCQTPSRPAGSAQDNTPAKRQPSDVQMYHTCKVVTLSPPPPTTRPTDADL